MITISKGAEIAFRAFMKGSENGKQRVGSDQRYAVYTDGTVDHEQIGIRKGRPF